MGTRSFVGVMIGDVCNTIYVHYDGYLDGVGSDLQQYATQQEVEELIGPGDRSSLLSGFYAESGEPNYDSAPQVFFNFEEFFESCQNSYCEWYYIFKDGLWYCGNTYKGSSLYKTLTLYSTARKIYFAEIKEMSYD